MKLTADDKGKFVFVTLWDHATGREIVFTETVGWVEDVNEDALILRHWRTPNSSDLSIAGEDDAIVISAIIDVRELPDPCP